MGTVHAFRHCVIGVANTATPFLLEEPSRLYRLVGGLFLRDSSRSDRFSAMHERPGVYRATIECRWDAAWASRLWGKDDRAFVFVASDVEPTSVFDLMVDRYGRAVGPARVFEALAAGLSRALHRLQAWVCHQP